MFTDALGLLKDAPVLTTSKDDFIDVCSDPVGNQGFYHFFDIVMMAVCGRRSSCWTKELKINERISAYGGMR
jgi:hypothetical protein